MRQAEPPSVRAIYRLWAKAPWSYNLSEYVAFLAHPNARRRAAIDGLNLRAGARVLEVGCGTGRNFDYILQRIGPTGHLIGLDYSAEMLRAAARECAARGWGNVTLVQSDAVVLDIGEDRVDGVLFILALNGLPDRLAALRRAYAVLRPGGTCVVCDKQPFTGWARVLNPPLRLVLGLLLGWRADVDVTADVRTVFGTVDVAVYASGSIVVIGTQRDPGPLYP